MKLENNQSQGIYVLLDVQADVILLISVLCHT
jgi:hypothetical protein